MKKIICLACVSLIYLSAIQAQSIELYDGRNNAKIENGATVTFGDPNEWNEIESPVVIKNMNSEGNTIKLKVKRQQLEMAGGASESFCVTQCYSPITNENPNDDVPTILYGKTFDTFHGIYVCEDERTPSRVQYTFSDINNPNDAITIYIVYSYGFHLGFQELVDKSTKLYYENGKLHMTYDVSALVSNSLKFDIYNISGIKVYSQTMKDTQGNETLNVSNLPKGIYICSFVSDTQTASVKFVVK